MIQASCQLEKEGFAELDMGAYTSLTPHPPAICPSASSQACRRERLQLATLSLFIPREPSAWTPNCLPSSTNGFWSPLYLSPFIVEPRTWPKHSIPCLPSYRPYPEQKERTLPDRSPVREKSTGGKGLTPPACPFHALWRLVTEGPLPLHPMPLALWPCSPPSCLADSLFHLGSHW